MEHNSRNILIRQMNASDKPFILSLASRFNAGVPPWRDTGKVLAFNQHELKKAVEDTASDATTLVAEDTEKNLLGFIKIISSADFFTNEPQGYISAIAVTEEAEGRGVGQMLMRAAEDWARSRGYRILSLEVFAKNTHARSFYQQLGYQEETLKLIKEL